MFWLRYYLLHSPAQGQKSGLSMTTQERSALVAGTITIFMAPFMAHAVNVALPAIQSEFSANAVELSWVTTSYLLSMTMVMLPVGRFADIHGRKRVFLAGIVIFSVTCGLMTMVPSMLWMIALRVLQGIGAACFISTGLAILTSIFPSSQRGKILGIYVGAVYFGGSVGPFAGGLITQHLGWRVIFLVVLLLGCVSFTVVFRNIRQEWAEARGESMDVAGTLIYAVSLFCIVYSATNLHAGWTWALFAAGIAGFIAFGYWTSKSPKPLFELGLFRDNRVFLFSNLAALINYSATYGVTFILSLYLQYLKGMSPQAAGMVLMAQPVLQVIFSPLAGRWSDTIQPRVLASTGMFLTMCGLICLSLLSPSAHLSLIVAILVVLGVGFGLFSTPNTSAIMGSVAKRHYGIASGISSTMRLIGQMASMALVTLVISIFIGELQLEPSTYPLLLRSSKVIFIFFSIACAVGIFLSLSRGKMREQGDPAQ
jgi:EmrB/QacA subfamily drug resistance transporter